MLVVAAVSGARSSGWPSGWPAQWYLYLGGPLGVLIVTSLVVGVRAVGVLRTGLAIVGGQLAGALLLDVLTPGGPGASPALVAGSLLTMAAVAVAGRGVRRPARDLSRRRAVAGWQTRRRVRVAPSSALPWSTPAPAQGARRRAPSPRSRW